MAVPNLKYAIGNSSSTTLSSSVTNTDTSMAITSDTNFNAKSGAGMVIIDEGESTEELAYSASKTGSTLSTPLVNRGLEGGSAQAHASGATIKGILTSDMWNDVIDAILVDHDDNGYHSSLTDANGCEWIKQTATSSAVNEITVANAAQNYSPTISATGDDTNIGMDFKMKGTGKMRKPSVVGIEVFDSATDTATGDGKAFFRVPAELNGMNLTGVAATVYTAGTTGTIDVQIRNKTDTQDMLSTKITIDSGETDTSTAATAAVINTSYDDVVTGDCLAIDVDAVHTTAAKGLYVEMRFELA